MGIKHVNIIDTACRPFKDIPPPDIKRQHSYNEKERGAQAQARLEELGHGAKERGVKDHVVVLYVSEINLCKI